MKVLLIDFAARIHDGWFGGVEVRIQNNFKKTRDLLSETVIISIPKIFVLQRKEEKQFKVDENIE